MTGHCPAMIEGMIEAALVPHQIRTEHVSWRKARSVHSIHSEMKIARAFRMVLARYTLHASCSYALIG